MPVDFVTEEQERGSGRYNGEPSEAQLAKYFYLSETDLDLVRQRRAIRTVWASHCKSARFVSWAPSLLILSMSRREPLRS